MTRTMLPLALALAGCAAGSWNRPNTSEAQFRADVYSCQQQAALTYRPAIVQPAPSRQTDCTAQGNSVSCTARPGADTAMYANVANAHAATAAQPAAVDACLMARGYRRS
jgi:hypothetical protein